MPKSSPFETALISRRRALGLMTGAAATIGLAACGAGGQTPEGLAFADSAGGAEDFLGAELHALLRKTPWDDLNELTALRSQAWAQSANASVLVDFQDEWREANRLTAQDRFGPDIVELYNASAHVYAPQLVDLSDIAERAEEQLGPWFQVAQDVAMVDGVWRAIPWAYTGHAINYRQDLLDEIGAPVPETYDDLIDVATRLFEADLPLASMSMSTEAAHDSGNFAYSMLWSFGAQEVDETGTRVALDSEATRSALRSFRELAAVSDPESSTIDEWGNNGSFLEGRTAITQNASSIYIGASADFPDIADSMTHGFYPTGPNGRHQLIEMNSLAIFDHSTNVDAAKGWIESVAGSEHVVDRAENSVAYFVPPINGLDDDSRMPWNVDDRFHGLRSIDAELHATGWPGPSTLEAELVNKNATIVRMFSAAGTTDDSIDSIVSTATEELRRVYET